MKKVIAGLEAILFDMDGTLVSSTPAVEKCWEAWAIRHKLSVEDVIHYIHGRPARDSIRHFTPHLNEEAEVDWMLQRELQEHEGIVAIAGARELLLSLGDFPWAIVTSADRDLANHRLKIANIPLPKFMVCVNDVVKGKPDPEGYLKAAQTLKVNPQNCLVAEDTLAGLEAGRRAGMKLLGLATTFTPEKLAVEYTTPHYLHVQFNRGQSSLEISN